MRYLTLAEALLIAEAVTGMSAPVLARASRLDLLDSALHVPQAGFGDVEFHSGFTDKAALLAVRIAKNHPLPDGDKRLAWQSLTMFCILNRYRLEVPPTTPSTSCSPSLPAKSTKPRWLIGSQNAFRHSTAHDARSGKVLGNPEAPLTSTGRLWRTILTGAAARR